MKLLSPVFGRAGGLQRAENPLLFAAGRRRAVRCNPAKPRRFSKPSRFLAGISTSIPHAVSALALVFSATSASAQQTPQDSINKLDEVIVSAVRATSKTPIAFTNVSTEELAQRNLGQDIPILLNLLPSVVTTSDAGMGIGYTGIRVRGSDATRVNVTVNGIPYNDSESQGTFWVNMPDFASSAGSIQLQRGVGTSTNGSGAFGASLNVLTEAYSQKAGGEISNSFGSFNSRKHTVKFTSGLLNDHFEFSGRLSNIESDGYIDRASSSLKSYFLQGNYVNKGTLIKALVFGGTEKTYQSWYGLEDPYKLKHNRTYNAAGAYVDNNGFTRFYDNQTDNYQQDHYQLHWNQKWNGNWNSTLALHYTPGKGYYENYKVGENLADYGIPSVVVEGALISKSDLIDQKWLDNDFYGTTFSIHYKKDKLDFVLGGGGNEYDGDHFGKVLWVRSVPLPQYKTTYYFDSAVKKDGNIFAKANYQLNPKFNLFADLQYRRVSYDANSDETAIVRDRFNFFNPKAGLTYTVDRQSELYASYARAHREPNRTDYENGSPRPEQLDDFELGWRYNNDKTRLNVNGYYMRYHDQLVLTGALDDVGSPIRENSGSSYRLGVELEAAIAVTSNLAVNPNVTVSRNQNNDFVFRRDGNLQNLGDTNIAFSPNLIVGNAIVFQPLKSFTLSLLTKYVGKQYMGNIDSERSILDAYVTNDLSVNYEWRPKSVFKAVVMSALVNNLFDYSYESNGYFYTYDDDFTVPGTLTTVEGAGYYPQAGINVLAGLTLKF